MDARRSTLLADIGRPLRAALTRFRITVNVARCQVVSSSGLIGLPAMVDHESEETHEMNVG